jgi:indoleamine 2,3-dioxygenase
MPERCDPYVYYHRVRRFLFGWKNNPAFPKGIHYEGVTAFGGRPQSFIGETGSQSAIIPFLDTVFGISDEADPLADHMLSLRDYIPPAHRAFIEQVGPRADLRGMLLRERPQEAVAAYNECIEATHAFRQLYLGYGARYMQQAQRDASNSNDVGTEGAPFMKYLRRHLDNVLHHVIR